MFSIINQLTIAGHKLALRLSRTFRIESSLCQRDCWNCVHAERICGRPGSWEDPPEPDIAICQIEFIGLQEEEENPAPYCPGFEPVLVGHCGNCRKEIAVPITEHRIWANEPYSGEPVALCSEACRIRYQQGQGE